LGKNYNINAKINFKGIENLVKAMSKEYQVKVGLLANKGGADELSDNMDVAGLGALQEFGADIKITPKMAAYLHFKAEELELPESTKKGDGYIHIPARSWLQMPLEKRNDLKKRIIKYFGESKESIENYIVDTGDLMSLAIVIGNSAVEQIQEAFNTDGFGQWKANSLFTVAQKGSAKPLVDTGSLRQKITFEVNNNG
jgi:phage gpG-like protein